MIAARDPANIREILVPTSDWDGCYKRYADPAAVTTYWTLESDKINELNNIRTALSNIYDYKQCRLDKIDLFEDWYDTVPDVTGKTTAKGWRSYLLSAADYARDATGRNLIDTTVGGTCTADGYRNAPATSDPEVYTCSSVNPSNSPSVYDWVSGPSSEYSSWTADRSSDMDSEKLNFETTCHNQAAT